VRVIDQRVWKEIGQTEAGNDVIERAIAYRRSGVVGETSDNDDCGPVQLDHGFKLPGAIDGES
jgi:hypothetical protein